MATDVLGPDDLAVLRNHTIKFKETKDKIKELNSEIKTLRNECKTIQKNLLVFVKTKNLMGEKFQIGGMRIQYAESKKNVENINRKMIYSRLLTFFEKKEKTWLYSADPEEKAKEATSAIYDNRGIKIEEYIKASNTKKK